MKNIILIAFSMLLFTCSNDDSDSNNNSNGNLKKTEAYFPSMDVNYSIDYKYDNIGRIESLNTQTINSSGTSNNSETYEYNSEGQIWKVIKPNGFNTEFTFSNGLIVSSMNMPNMTSTLYIYDSSDRLIKQEIYGDDGDINYEYDYLYDEQNNILSREVSGNSNYIHVYEYDNNPNPYFNVYANQEIAKVLEINPNNFMNRTKSIGSSQTVYTHEYTYNSSNLPLTSKEYENGNLVGQTAYSY
ncbi:MULTISPECIES: hypothetical protein [Bizionia]|uniref:RHS repeat protein n=1 Tax=Bizionia algoritergicola TaxID=291187 RepID=A0A5D0R1S6_9FLAO|nr:MULTISPECIES: hypothetical protein [Bizionia]TYB75029.1 hypothetical protein ES675_02530 [Bizionia algoritergicola]